MPEWGELQVDQLRFMAREHGDAVGYRNLDSDEQITFAQWDEQSNRLARWLVGERIEKGDRVSIYLPSEEVLRWIVAYAAIHKAGAVAVPTNTRFSLTELLATLGHAEIAAMVTSESLLPTALELRAAVPALQTICSHGGTADDCVPWKTALAESDDEIQIPLEPSDMADIMFTSGTTGMPKGVVVRHRDVSMIPNMDAGWAGKGWMHGAPLFTFAGIAFIYNPMKMGLEGLFLPKFEAGHWLETVERKRPVMGFLVPAMAELLVAHTHFSEADLSSLQLLAIGSAPLAPKTLEILQEKIPDATVLNSFGMTEAGPAYIVMPPGEEKERLGSIGQPVPPLEVKIVDAFDEEVPPGEVGEMLMRLPGRQREYYKNDDATASTWTEDGWLRSGDLARQDDESFLYVVGRKKDMIIRGGNNVYATDVESVLLEHPQVLEAAVIGVPHYVLGEDVAAFVVTKPGETLTAEELEDFCAERMADYKRPRHITFLDELPRNAIGKVIKRQLKASAADAR